MTGMALGAIAMIVFTRLTPGGSYATHILPGLLDHRRGDGVHLRARDRNRDPRRRSPRDRRRLGDGQYLPADRWLGRAGAAEHGVSERRRQLRPSHLGLPGLASAAAVHGYTTAFWWAAGIFATGFVLALVILPPKAEACARARSGRRSRAESPMPTTSRLRPPPPPPTVRDEHPASARAGSSSERGGSPDLRDSPATDPSP